MAIAETAVVSTNALTGTSGTSDTFLPVSGQWYLFWVSNKNAGQEEPTGLTHSSFSDIAQVATRTIGTLRRVSLYEGYCDQAPATEGVVVSFGAADQDAIVIRVKTYTGMHASVPVVQFKTATATGTVAAVTFDAGTTVGNAVAGAIAFASNSATLVWDSTMVAAGNAGSGLADAIRTYNGFVAGQEDSPSGVISSSFEWGEIAVEIAASSESGVVGQSTSNRTTRRRRR